ncbi:MAG: hypothetical protein E6772_09725 [Dysgonomonas sp.]|nr:hypothetical protein [Dysgonomonas sp.]
MKEIKIIIKESTDKHGDICFHACLELFPEIKNIGYNKESAINGLKDLINMDIGFKQINLSDFPDYIPDKLEQEFNIYSEEELYDNDLYIFTCQEINEEI